MGRCTYYTVFWGIVPEEILSGRKKKVDRREVYRRTEILYDKKKINRLVYHIWFATGYYICAEHV